MFFLTFCGDVIKGGVSTGGAVTILADEPFLQPPQPPFQPFSLLQPFGTPFDVPKVLDASLPSERTATRQVSESGPLKGYNPVKQ